MAECTEIYSFVYLYMLYSAQHAAPVEKLQYAAISHQWEIEFKWLKIKNEFKIIKI
jgi:hypothetical protein